MALAPIECKPNDCVDKKYLVKKKIGEGACGQVFLVALPDKDGKPGHARAAMKVEPRMKCKDDEILKMEIFVLKKTQRSKHVCRLIAFGHAPTFTYVVMSLLGPELSVCKKRSANGKLTHPTAIRLTFQAVKGLQDLHEAGFIHRDIKPSNMALGLSNSVLYIYDFGLARQILVDNGRGGFKLRDERPRVMFRGTSRYVSSNVHNYREQGRHDDLIACLHSMIECTATLPWRGHQPKEAAKMKEKTTDQELCKDCPPSFLEVMRMLKKLRYTDIPAYGSIFNLLKKDLPPTMKMADPYEFTRKGVSDADLEKSGRDRAELDKEQGECDQRTMNDMEDSVVTEESNSRGTDTGEFPANDDTLDGM